MYGKTIENLRNRIDIKLVNNEENHLKYTSKSNYLLHKTFDNNLVLARKTKLVFKLNKPAYIGMCILELSKALTYEFHFDNIKNYYFLIIMLFADTASLMHEIKTEDVYEDFSSNKEIFDFRRHE